LNALAALNAALEKVYANCVVPWGGLISAGRGVKAKYVFSENTMKRHLVELGERSGVLQFTLQITQLHTSEQTNQRLKEVNKGVKLSHAILSV
jgi:hypothetical protein